MHTTILKYRRLAIGVTAILLLFGTVHAYAVIDGISGPAFSLTARTGRVITADGGNILVWGYGNSAGQTQYPGPTLIVTEGDLVTVTLTNDLPAEAENVSIVFPGHSVVATGGLPGLLTREAPPDGVTSVTYTFTASHPGTYLYYSGSHPELQIEMGLVGAIIVRPLNGIGAYGHANTVYDREYLFLLTEMDINVHLLAEFGPLSAVDNTTHWPVYWFINGRAFPDTMFPAFAPWLPYQPYSALARMHPGEKVLMRVIGAGRDLHPFHHHGADARIIARDGRLLESTPGIGPDLGQAVFSIKSIPGETVDAIYTWTGENLGWDIYGDPADPNNPNFGHTCVDTINNETGAASPDGFDDSTYEWCADHGKPLPVVLPELQSLTFGGLYSGSPFMGVLGLLPPGEGGLNPNAAFTHIWHSHTEKEIVNNDIFPGGMITFVLIEPPDIDIP